MVRLDSDSWSGSPRPPPSHRVYQCTSHKENWRSYHQRHESRVFFSGQIEIRTVLILFVGTPLIEIWNGRASARVMHEQTSEPKPYKDSQATNNLREYETQLPCIAQLVHQGTVTVSLEHPRKRRINRGRYARERVNS
jgi:hypothetical protein